MKKISMLLAIVIVTLTSCSKKEQCECTTVLYDTSGYYLSSQEKEYQVTNAADCASYNFNAPTEVTNCQLDVD